MLKRRNVFYFIPWPKLAKQGNNVNFTQLITLFTEYWDIGQNSMKKTHAILSN